MDDIAQAPQPQPQAAHSNLRERKKETKPCLSSYSSHFTTIGNFFFSPSKFMLDSKIRIDY